MNIQGSVNSILGAIAGASFLKGQKKQIGLQQKQTDIAQEQMKAFQASEEGQAYEAFKTQNELADLGLKVERGPKSEMFGENPENETVLEFNGMRILAEKESKAADALQAKIAEQRNKISKSEALKKLRDNMSNTTYKKVEHKIKKEEQKNG